MTALITQTTNAIMTSSRYSSMATTLGAIVAVLVIALLILKEILRVLDPQRAKGWLQTLNIAIAPLILTLGFILAIRMLRLLGLA